MAFVGHTEKEIIDYISKNPTHRVWGYIRVSSKGQEDGESLNAQQKEISEYCARKKLGTPAFVSEVGSATKPLFAVDMSRVTKKKKKEIETDPRPLFLQIVAHATQLKNAHLIVWKLDRFARHQNDQELIMNLLRSEGTKLHSTLASEENIIAGTGDDPARTMMRQIFGAVAQYEAGMIQIRMEMGRRHKAGRGGYTGGRPPFGYKAVNKDLVLDRYESEIVKIIYELRSNHNYTQQAITNYLNKNKSDEAPDITQQRVSRILSPECLRLYNGYYMDPYYGTETFKEKLVIIPEENTDVSGNG